MTTHKETLTLALEKAFELGKKFCEPTNSNYFHANVNGELARLIERTQEALAQPEQEPVAWRAWFDADNSAKWLFTLWPEEEHPSFDWQPLYTHPPVPTAQPKEPEQEPVAEVVIGKYPWDYGLSVVYLEKCLLAGTKLYTTPPQRKPWVSLSWSTQISKEAEKVEQAYGFVQGAQWAEAKLRELNDIKGDA